MKKKLNYTVAFDIGTSSIGWSIINNDTKQLVSRSRNYQVIDYTNNEKVTKKSTRKNFWGVYLFSEGLTAQDRRTFRSARRRYSHRRNRLALLQRLFEEEILKIDDSFFIRLQDSSLYPEDKSEKIRTAPNKKQSILFTDSNYSDQQYHEEYPTIYHLRKELIDNPSQKDLRLVYLALHHLIKYRGHFTLEGQNISVEHLDIDTDLKSVFEQFDKLTNKRINKITNWNTFKQLLTDNTTNRTRKKELFVEALLIQVPDADKKIITELAEALVGLKFDLEKLVNEKLPIIKEEKLETNFSISEEKLETIMQTLEEVMSEESFGFLQQLLATYQAIELARLLQVSEAVDTKAYFSNAMVNKYEEHKKDLACLKRFWRDNFSNDDYKKMFGSKIIDTKAINYTNYIKTGKIAKKDFYEVIKTKVQKSEKCSDESLRQFILQRIEDDAFLPKQRTSDNALIPYQVHLDELKKILDNQSVHYPFLKENKEKIQTLLSFRIPYYVGPLSRKKDGDYTSPFAWLKIRDGKTEPITPWNFSEIVDIDQTAQNFIERMTNSCSYLLGEPVVPKHSLLYQKFTVLNEISNLRFKDGEKKIRPSVKMKQQIYQELFQKKKKVTKKQLKEWLEEKAYPEAQLEITGLTDGKNFNSSLSSYHEFVNILGKEEIENHVDDIEQIIRYLTLFEDNKILQRKLSAEFGHWLSPKQLKELSKKRLKGWGTLSKKLLTELKVPNINGEGITIMDELWQTEANFMQMLRKSYPYGEQTISFQELINQEIEQDLKDQDPLSLENVRSLPTSPANKKAIYNVFKLLKEIIQIMGCDPENIVIEFAREDQNSHQTIPRKKRVEKQLAILEEETKNCLKELKEQDNQLSNQRLFLYFLQNGKCLYSGKPLNIDTLSSDCEMDHILPQAYIKDDSTDNLALVLKNENQRKKDNLLLDSKIIEHQKIWWQKLLNANLMSPKKYRNLTRTEVTEGEKIGFIQRQLVETRQISKYVAQLLDAALPASRILALKADLTSNFRKKYGILKIRELNDYHHAHDAFINGIIGLYVTKKYAGTNKGNFFEYGKFSSSYNHFLEERKKLAKEKGNNLRNVFGFIIDALNKEQTNQANEVIWTENDLKQILKTLTYSQCNVVKQQEVNTGAFYNETIYKKTGSSKNKIPLKKGLDVEKYGYYSSEESAYSVLIDYQKDKSTREKKLIGIPIRFVDQLKSPEKLEEFISEKLKKDFVILKSKVQNNQLFIDEKGKQYLSTPLETHSAEQLVLPLSITKNLYNALNGNNELLDTAYNELTSVLFEKRIDKFIFFSDTIERLYSYNQFFINLTSETKYKVLSDVLALVHADKRFIDFKKTLQKDFKSNEGRNQKPNGLSFSDSLTFIHLSPTGLYERREIL